MSIRLVVTRGYGNGTFNGTVADVVRRGYGSDATAVVPAPVRQNTGGWGQWFDYEQHRKNEAKKERADEKRLAQKIKDNIVREIALNERRIEEESAKLNDLARLGRLVEKHQASIAGLDNPRLTFVMQEALEKHTFSKLERLERELGIMREEEEFLMQATMILMNQ
jgi:hypothetical protein